MGCDTVHALNASIQLMDEIRQLKKDLSAGRADEYGETFEFAGRDTKTDLEDYHQVRTAVRDITRRLNVSDDDVGERITSLLNERTKLVKELKQSTAGGKLSVDDLIEQGERVGGALMIVTDTPGANPNVMRGWIDQIRKKSDAPTAVLLAAVQGERVMLVGGLSRDLVDRGLKAGDWVGAAATAVGGGGGGRPDMAQAGGKDPSRLPDALEEAKTSMRRQLAQ
jgi:alanyl-tRNA synthetase